MLVGVISDTHIPGRAKRLPDEVTEAFDGVDLILHAGDVVDRIVIDELSALAPVSAVLGNCDPWDLGLPEQDEFSVDQVRIGMTHIPGPRDGLRRRMSSMFPACRVVIFGHTHIPLLDDDGTLMLLNPGTACDPRWGSSLRSVAVLTVSGATVQAQHIRF